MGISPTEKEIIARVMHSVPGALGLRMLVFGSQARADAAFGSDIDIGLERRDGTPLPPGLVADIQEAFDESSLEKRVEVVDLARTSHRFRNEALSQVISL